MLHTAIGLVNAAGAVLFRQHDNSLEPAAQLLSRQAQGWSDNLLAECAQAADKAIIERRGAFTPLRNNPDASIICCPVPSSTGNAAYCLSVFAVLGDNAPEPYLIVLQLLAATMVLAEKKQGPSPLVAMLAGDGAFQSDGLYLGAAVRQWARADIIALGFCENGGKIQVATVSDVASPEKKTHRSRLLENVLRESAEQETALIWPPASEPDDSTGSLLLKELVQEMSMQQGCAVSLHAPGSSDVVCLVLLWRSIAEREPLVAELQDQRALLNPLFFHVLKRSMANRIPRGSQSSRLKKVMVGGAAFFFLGWFFFFPTDFNLHPGSQVKPVQVRYVVAAFDGIIDDVFVEPGDQVASGSELVTLDGREISLELSSLAADSSKALKMRDSHHVRGDVAAAQMAQLEYQRLQERIKLLSIRQTQLRISSPTDGIVLSGDIKRSRKGPVNKGQVLFEIAPIDTVLIEMGIPDEDISHVDIGQPVSVIFDAFPRRTWHGKVDRVSPASRLIDGDNLFTASLELDNADRSLQPGMRGRAKIFIDRRSPAWIYFHKPWYSLQRLLRKLF